MLNHAKVMKELQRVADKLFFNFEDEGDCARTVWKKISDDSTFAHKIKTVDVPWMLPSWSGRLDDIFVVKKEFEAYHVLAVDGSQIYPDKHQGTSCSLINIGSVHLRYGLSGRSVQLYSDPLVFIGDEEKELHETPNELVNCRRQEWEFFAGIKHSTLMHQQTNDDTSLFLFDGSLIFWHLESKERDVKVRFLASYLDSLQKLYEQQVLLAGYISLTKSKELVNLLRVALAFFAQELGVSEYVQQLKVTLEYMTDAHIVRFFLKPFTRTTVFKNHSTITKHYPVDLHPHFLYLHVGSEIVRLEFPAWIAQQAALVEQLTTLVADQVLKGDGYPVALAEAHEQAVVKGADRDFFYHMVKKIGLSEKHRSLYSQKIRSKRGIRV